MRRLCPSTSLKPDPGLRLSSSSTQVYTLPLLPIPRLALFSSDSVGLSLHRARSFDYCFVKCDVKDSKITLPSAWLPLYRLLRPLSRFSYFLPRFLSRAMILLFLPSSIHRRTTRRYHPISPPFWVPSSRRGKCSLRKFKFILGSRSLEERIKGPGHGAVRKHASLLNPIRSRYARRICCGS